MLKKLLQVILPPSPADQRAERYRNLIREEAKIGGQVFGPVPEGRRREFFCLDEHTWVWHEEWADEKGARRSVTTRYDVRPSGILKAQDGQQYRPVGREEAVRLYNATVLYNQMVDQHFAPYLAA